MADPEDWITKLPPNTVWADIRIQVALPADSLPGVDPVVTLEQTLDEGKKEMLISLMQYGTPHWGGETTIGKTDT